MSLEESCYILISSYYTNDVSNQENLLKDIEKGDDKVKISALKEIIAGLLNGIKYPLVLISVIRFILPTKNNYLKKLLLLYFEIVAKRGDDGKLLPQMILVCDSYRKDLEHPNEYIRGATLRFLSKLKEPELLEPLIPTIIQNLTHKNSFVRKNAILCIYTIFKKFEYLIPDSSEIIYECLIKENDKTCKRNAFMMLAYSDQERALDYINDRLDDILSFGDILQLTFIELVYKVCQNNPYERSHFIKPIYQLLNVQSNSYPNRFEAAKTLNALTTAPTAVSAVLKCFTDLLMKESDNNIKLVVLERIEATRNNPLTAKIISEECSSLLRCLNCTDTEVKKKILGIVENSISAKNVNDIVNILKKELLKTHEELELNDDYRLLLVKTLYSCCVKFQNIAADVVVLLLEFIGEIQLSADSIIRNIKELMEPPSPLRKIIITKLLDLFDYIKSPSVFRTCLWILGEYCEDVESIDLALQTIQCSIGSLPFETINCKDSDKEKSVYLENNTAICKINPDGSYATQSAFTYSVPSNTPQSLVPTSQTLLRKLILESETFLAVVLSSTLTKLILRRRNIASIEENKNNKWIAQIMLIITCILQILKRNSSSSTSEPSERLILLLKILSDPNQPIENILLNDCRTSFVDLINNELREETIENKRKNQNNETKIDDIIAFEYLNKENEFQDEFKTSLSLAIGFNGKKSFSTELSKVFQLTGLSDPIYSEAYLTIDQFDIFLDVLIVNQTSDTLQNLSLDFSFLGDLKIIERPDVFTVPPNGVLTIKVNIKVCSSEIGVIFGSINYDVSNPHCTMACVVLNDIQVDVTNYIYPSVCESEKFRKIWIELEWENKITIITDIKSQEEYSNHIASLTNMNCLHFGASLKDCNFYAATLYGQTIFGEDVLACVSIEIDSSHKLSGYIRIRAKSQSLVSNLGTLINLRQQNVLLK